VVRSVLNSRFHPPISCMRAYAHPNPLTVLANRALPELERLDGGTNVALLRAELVALRNIAESASAETAFLQTQRCLSLLRSISEPPLLLDGGLDGYRYSPEGFTTFLSRLAESLERGANQGLYPTVIEIDGLRYQRLDGELMEQSDFFTWTPPERTFVARGLALYLPRAVAEFLPVVKHGRRKGDSQGFTVARLGQEVTGPGVALLLGRWTEQMEQIYITAAAEEQYQIFRRKLGDGHAVYYY